MLGSQRRPRCPNGSIRNKKTGECVAKNTIVRRPRCKNGTRKNRKTGECVPRLQTRIRKRVVRHLERPLQKKQSLLLSKFCPDTGYCLSLGSNEELVKNYFENFENLSFIYTSEVKQIGHKSSNGVVYELVFKKGKHKASVILKTAVDHLSDNLFYEYLVGLRFINYQCRFFPCFLETYGYYIFKKKSTMNHFDKNRSSTTLSSPTSKTNKRISWKQILTKIPINTENQIKNELTNACRQSDINAIMIQHFKNFTTFSDQLKNNFSSIRYEIFSLLYQIYFPLSVLSDIYTHYDLHGNNIGLYKPFTGNKYLLLRYHSKKKKTVFEIKSEFIVKLIDYGRNYVMTPSMADQDRIGYLNTEDTIDYLCRIAECNRNLVMAKIIEKKSNQYKIQYYEKYVYVKEQHLLPKIDGSEYKKGDLVEIDPRGVPPPLRNREMYFEKMNSKKEAILCYSARSSDNSVFISYKDLFPLTRDYDTENKNMNYSIGEIVYYNLNNLKCGSNVGFYMLENREINPAQDLQIIHSLNEHHYNSNMGIHLRKEKDLHKLSFKRDGYKSSQSTPVIQTVNDVRNWLESGVLKDSISNYENKKYDATWKLAGIMNIYDDQTTPFTYEKIDMDI